MNPEIKHRFLRTLSANVFGQVVTIGTQLINVPLFLSAWGPELYGEWLILSALPTFIIQGGSGFASASGTEMIVQVQADRRRVIEIYHTSVAITLFFVVASIIAAGVLSAFDLGSKLGFAHIGGADINALFLLLSAQVALQFVVALYVAGFRGAGMFARGFMWQHVSRLGSFIAGAGVLFSGGTPVRVAIAMLLGQAATVAAALVALHVRASWLTPGLSEFSWAAFGRLWRPSIADTIMPLALGLRLQAIVVILGVFCSPIAVAVFVSLRTMASTLLQCSRIVNRAAQQELSVAFGKHQIQFAQRLHQRLLSFTLWTSLFATLCLIAVGKLAFEYWTNGVLDYSGSVLFLLLLSMVIHALAITNATVLRAANLHVTFARDLLLCVICGIIIAVPLIATIGIYGAAITLLVIDSVALLLSFRQCRQITQDKSLDLWKAILSPPWSQFGRQVAKVL